MKPDNCTTAAAASVDDAAHAVLLDDLLARAGSCFARRETRLTCRDMVHGLLMELDDHNCWTMAEAAGHPGPYRMQHLLSRARCDDQGLLGCAADWAADEERRELAGVPDEVMFATKPQLAGTLLQQAHNRGIRAAFAAGDEVYGGLDLRTSIRGRGTGYVLAVRSSHMVTLPSGRRLAVKNAAGLLKPAMWQRMRTGSATKGAKDYHWAMIEITPDDTPDGHDDGHAFLLLRKHRCTGTVSYFLCWTPVPVPLATLIKVAVTRWRIEEDHQLGKQAARLDSGQVTTWTSWHRWTAIALLAYAFLAVAAACQRASATQTPANSDSSPSPSLSCCGSSAAP